MQTLHIALFALGLNFNSSVLAAAQNGSINLWPVESKAAGNKVAMEQKSEEARKQMNRKVRNQNIRVCTHRSTDG